jgi:hypothetical protein
MVLETDRHAADEAVRRLEESGHEVVKCHGDGEQPWPCAALRPDRRCPLDDGVDVALTVRAHPYPRPASTEDGVTCALRHHVPLVVAGTSALNPFERFVTIDAHDGDVVSACEEATRRPLAAHGRAATDEVHRLLAKAGLEAGEATVVARRHGDLVRVRIHVPGGLDHRLADVLAVRVEGAVRAVDRYTAGIDVSVS